MKCIGFVIAALGIVACSTSTPNRYIGMADQVMEYQLDGNQFAVVVVMDGMTSSEAKNMARKRAAEITAQQGNRYFTVDSEYETQVIKSDDDMSNQRFYGNMYQELIIEGNFNRERLRYNSVPNTTMYSAVRLVFTSYKMKPSGKAIDACKLTHCQGF